MIQSISKSILTVQRKEPNKPCTPLSWANSPLYFSAILDLRKTSWDRSVLIGMVQNG